MPLTSGSATLNAVANMVGLQKYNKDEIRFNLVPNPSTGLVTVNVSSFDSAQDDKKKNRSFKFLERVFYYSTITKQHTSIDLHQLHDGVYYVKLSGKEDGIKKLVLQH